MAKENFDGYTKQQIDGAIRAQCLQGMMGHQSQCDFENAVHDRMIQCCPVMHHDITASYNLFGSDLAGVRGKTVWRKPTRIDPEYVNIPQDLIQQNK